MVATTKYASIRSTFRCPPPNFRHCEDVAARKSRVSLQMNHLCSSTALLILAVAASCAARAAEPTPDQVEFFEKRIRPLLLDACYKCHSTTSEKLKGGLMLDSREALLKGGDTGPAIVPGNLEKSLLIEAIHWTNTDLQMP